MGTNAEGVYVGGIDIGSTTTKAVILDQEKNIRASKIISTGAAVSSAISECVQQCLSQAGISGGDVKTWISTGYGRNLVDFAERSVTELSCHAKGAHFIVPSVQTVIDVGGQDCKAISVLPNGKVKKFVMNDKCAAGTGKFMEVIARAMEIKLDEMTDYAARSSQHLEVSSVCTVFAESEVISLFSQGHRKEDIVAAIYRSIARRIRGLVNQIGIADDVVMTGGGAKNKGLVRALEEALNIRITVSGDPQLMGAMGAANIAWETVFG